MRWLHVNGRLDRATQVIKKIAKFNGKDELNIQLCEIKSVSHGSDLRTLFQTRSMSFLSLNIGFAW